jgi:5'-nucleotidase (lipoprotein e(P4) family)
MIPPGGRDVMRRLIFGGVVVAALAYPAPARAQAPLDEHLGIRYVRDSAEYHALSRQVYRQAAMAVDAARTGAPGAWAVVLDVDETALDNSVYQLERAAYGSSYDPVSWNAWVRREEAGSLPGVVEFVRGVRAAGGRIAWITNRDEATREETRRNLAREGLWHDGDRLCLETDKEYTKARRRRELREGQGACAWAGDPVRVVAYVGDQMGDFPGAGEEEGGTGGPPGDEAFGVRFFLLPNPMYGRWTMGVTRPAPVRGREAAPVPAPVRP